MAKRKRVSKSSARRKNRAVQLEPLEPRALLTTIFGGETFEYLDANEQRIRIQVSGDAIVELIAGDIDTTVPVSTFNPASSLILGNIPGRVLSSPIPGRSGVNLFGGVGGADGIEVIGTTPIVDPLTNYGTIVRNNGGSRSINIRGLASSPTTGLTYGFNTGLVTDIQGEATLAQLVQLSNDDGSSEVMTNLHQASLAEDVMSVLSNQLGTVEEVAINPTTGLMYAINAEPTGSRLYTVNRTTGTVTSLGFIRNASTARNLTDVRSMAFDASGNLYVLTSDYDGNPSADASGGAFTVAPGQSANTDPARVRISTASGAFNNADAEPLLIDGQKTALDYTGMAYNTTDGLFYASLNAINPATGVRTTTLHVLPTPGGAQSITPAVRGGVTVNDIPAGIDAIAFAVNSANQRILVGVDSSNADANGVTRTRLLSIPFAASQADILLAAPLSAPGYTVTTHSLASYTEAGDTRPLLFTVGADAATSEISVIRGSAITLPTNRETGLSAVLSIGGADFQPDIGNSTDGRLFFVAEAAEGADGSTPVNRMYHLDVEAANRSSIQNSLVLVPGTISDTAAPLAVVGLAFDQTSGSSATLYIGVNGGTQVTSRIGVISPTNANNLTLGASVTVRDRLVNNLSGISFVNDDPLVAETEIYGIQYGGSIGLAGQDDGTPQLLRIGIDTARALQLGSTVDPEAPSIGGGVAGDKLEGITWNPTLINPFDGSVGVLLGTDSESDHLIYIDNRFRFPASDVFHIYVTQSSSDAYIRMYEVEGDESAPVPFSGQAEGLRVTTVATGGFPVVVTDSVSGTGRLRIGAQTEITDQDPPLDLIPIVQAPLDFTIGTRPGSLHNGVITAGIEFAQNILEFATDDPDTALEDRTLGLGAAATNIKHLAISRGGVVVGIDTDGLASTGQSTTGGSNELVIINPETNLVTSTIEMTYFDGADFQPLLGGSGLAWGDPDFDGTQELYGIFRIDGVPAFGTIDINTGIFTPVGGANLSAWFGVSSVIDSMAFAPSAGTSTGLQGLYVLGRTDAVDENTPQSIYEIKYSVNGSGIINLVTDVDLRSTISSALTSIVSFAFDAAGNLFGIDNYNARLVSIGLGTGLIGQTVATAIGTLRPTAAALAYDTTNDTFYAIDNVFGAASAASSSTGSSALMRLRGVSNTSPIGQNIDQILLGGTVFGKVHLTGSINLFYAGWILTGQTAGQLLYDASEIPENFYVAGDIDSLITINALGTNTVNGDNEAQVYYTGFDLHVGGRVGEIKTVIGGFLGSVQVDNAVLPASVPNRPTSFYYETEINTRRTLSAELAFVFAGRLATTNSGDGTLSFLNDGIASAQRVGTIRPTTPGSDSRIEIRGTHENQQLTSESTDYYAVSLLAGQTITARIVTPGFYPPLSLGIFDPEGTLVATDYNTLGGGEGSTITFTAKQAGEYRFATGDYLEDIANAVSSGTFRPFDTPYTIYIDHVGDVALGGMVINANMYSALFSGTPLVNASYGDIGGITVGGALFTGTDDFSADLIDLYPAISSQRGSVRSVVAARMGNAFDSYRVSDTVVITAAIDIGAVKTLPDPLDPTSEDSGDAALSNPRSANIALRSGRNTQLIDIGGKLLLDIEAGGAIGVLRAGNMGSTIVASSIVVNSDLTGNDGIIDLISVTGDFGSLRAGGPAITTGPGGNVRYIVAGGDVYQDRFFALGYPSSITLSPGQSFNFRDDSGGTSTLRPTGDIPNPLLATDPTAPATISPSLVIQPYSIRGSGGGVLVSVITNSGLSITGNSLGNGGPVEIGAIVSTAAHGTAVLRNETTNKLEQIALDPINNINITIGGDGLGVVDVFSVSGTLDIDGDATYFTNIVNNSGGELVNVRAASVAKIISSGTVGLAKSYTGNTVGGDLLPRGLDDAGPFRNQRSGILIVGGLNDPGNIISLSAGKGVGNIIVQRGIDSIIANAGGVDVPGEFEGINAPIYVLSDILTIQIGEGVAESGSGDVSFAGVYAGGSIGSITNQGIGSDIYGNIVASGLPAEFTQTPSEYIPATQSTGIGNITLVDGAIIDAHISTARPQDSRNFAGTYVLQGGSIGAISLPGRGGIIGAEVLTASLGDVTNPDGFGIINSYFSGTADAVFGNFVAGGYGFRNVQIISGNYIGDITATGTGQTLSDSQFTPSVRNSEIDPDLGTIYNDLGKALEGQPRIAGLIRDVYFSAVGNLGTVSGYRIDATDPVFAPSQFNVGNQIAGIKTISTINGLNVTTGNLGLFSPGGTISNMTVTVAGQIKDVIITGNFTGGSSIIAAGPNGNIGKLTIVGNFSGDIIADGRVGDINVTGDLSGNITIRALNLGALALGSLVLGGSYSNGALDVNGSVGTIQVAGNFGLVGDSLTINGSLANLIVGSNLALSDTSMGLNLLVRDDLNNANIRGAVEGSFGVGGRLERLTITSNSTTPNSTVIAEEMQIGRGVGQITVTGGNIAGSITVGLDIERFNLSGGSVLDTSIITSSFGNVRAFTINGGDLLGDLRAPNGDIGSVVITGSNIGGDSLIAARNISSIRIDGSLLSGATIVAANVLGTLSIGGSIEAGTSITALSGANITVGGNMLGALAYGHAAAGSRINVAGNMGGTTSIDANATIMVGGNVVDGSTITIGRNLDQLSVGGAVLGSIIVNGTGTTWTLGSASGAVLTTGSDLRTFRVLGGFDNSILQVGISAGNNNVFALSLGGIDLNEASRIATLSSVSLGSMSSSIVASGGDIGSINVAGAMANSSISSGLSLGSIAIANAIDAGSLANPNAARTGTDRAILRGDIKSASVGDGMTGSFITAGVDAGEGGNFSSPSVLISRSGERPLGGGTSLIGSVTAALDGASGVLADSGISKNNTTGTGVVNANVTYDVTTNVDLLGGVAIQTLVGTATKATPLSYTLNNGSVVTITVSGNGSVAIHDQAGVDTDNLIDTLLITGADAKTRVTIKTSTPGTATIGRVLTSDDGGVGDFSFDGTLIGAAGGTGPAIWNEGAMKKFTLAGISDNVTGVLGGSVATFTLGTQGQGELQILGDVKKMTISTGTGDPLLSALGTYLANAFNSISANSVGAVFAHVNGSLVRLNPTVTNGSISSTTITDGFSGDVLSLLGMDFSPTNTLYGVTSVFNSSPTVRVGTMTSTLSDLRLSGLAVSPAGLIYAIQHFDADNDSVTDYDRLVRINPTTGGITNVGRVLGFFGDTFVENITQLAFDNSGNLYALLNDIDGTGSANGTGVAIGRISLTPDNNGFVRLGGPTSTSLPPRLLNAGGVLNQFKGLAVNSDGTIYAIRRNLIDTADDLVTISSTGTVTSVGGGSILLDVNGDGAGETATAIRGIGFDEAGNLVALNLRAGQNELIGLRTNNIADPSKFQLLLGGAELTSGLDAFAIGRSGDFSTYAYDQDASGGAFYTNNNAEVLTLGTIDVSGGPANGRFSTLLPLNSDADGTGLTSLRAIAVGAAGVGNIYVASTINEFIRYNSDGSFHSNLGVFTDSNTGVEVQISTLVYDDTTNTLLGYDPVFNRMVIVNIADGTVSATTNPGAISTDLTNLTMDPTNGQFLTFNTTLRQFFALNGTTESALGGISASNIAALNITGASSARVTASKSFGKVSVAENFTGIISTPYAMKSFAARDGFAGAVATGDDLGSVKLTGSVLSDGIVVSDRDIKSFSQKSGTFAGKIQSRTAGKIAITGAMTDDALIQIIQTASALSIGGDLNGTVELGSTAGKGLSFKGGISSTALLAIGDDLKSLSISGNVAQGAIISVDGLASSIAVKGTHAGLIYTRLGATKADFATLDLGMFVSGLDIGTVNVKGSMTNAIVAAGIWLGDDLALNTEDDLITGGNITSLKVGGDYQDSVTTAGVLPSVHTGQYIPGVSDNRLFVGNTGSSDIRLVDGADAGGFISSTISSISVRGSVYSSSIASGRVAVATAADAITSATAGEFIVTLRQRVYSDPPGAPLVVSATRVNSREIRVIFSEQINTGSFITAIDGNGDNLFDSSGDVAGSIVLTDTDTLATISDVQLSYATQITAEGDTQGILTIRRTEDFPDTGSLQILLNGINEDSPEYVIYDRSGLRSTRRNPAFLDNPADAIDLFGTVLDGDDTGAEGSDYQATL